MTEREEFETWFIAKFPEDKALLRRHGDNSYANSWTAGIWEGWQAARSTPKQGEAEQDELSDDNLIAWLDGQFALHGEYEDKAAAMRLRFLSGGPSRSVEPVPELPKEHADRWLENRSQILDAIRAQGFALVQSAHGWALMRLGPIDAASASPSVEPPQAAHQEPGWVRVPIELLESARDDVAEVVAINRQNYGERLMRRQQPSIDLLVQLDAFLAAPKEPKP